MILKVKREIELNDKKYDIGMYTIGDTIDIQNYVSQQKDKIKKLILEEKKEAIRRDFKSVGQVVDVNLLINCEVSDNEIYATGFNNLIVRQQLKVLLNKYQSVSDEEIDTILNNCLEKEVEDVILSAMDLPEVEEQKNSSKPSL